MEAIWRVKLRDVRERQGLSRRQLAERSGLSQETVRGYEGGRRRPSRERLVQLLSSAGATAYETNEVLSMAGFVTPPTLFPAAEYPNYYFSIDELQDEVEQAEWPVFVLNNANEVVAANAPVEALWGIDFARERAHRTAAQLNVLSVASQRRFADRILNWDECVGTMAAVLKGRPADVVSLEAPNAYFSDVFAEFAAGDPAFLARLVEVWVKTPARDPKVRWSYRITWCDEEFGEMRFRCVVSTASEPGALSFNDWQPLDSETWRVLEQVKARQPRR